MNCQHTVARIPTVFQSSFPRDKIASLVRGYFLFSEIRVHDEFRFRFGLGTNKLFII